MMAPVAAGLVGLAGSGLWPIVLMSASGEAERLQSEIAKKHGLSEGWGKLFEAYRNTLTSSIKKYYRDLGGKKVIWDVVTNVEPYFPFAETSYVTRHHPFGLVRIPESLLKKHGPQMEVFLRHLLVPNVSYYKPGEIGKQFRLAVVLPERYATPEIALHEIGHVTDYMKSGLPKRPKVLVREAILRNVASAIGPLASIGIGYLSGKGDVSPGKASLAIGLTGLLASAPSMISEVKATHWALTEGKRMLEKEFKTVLPGKKMPFKRWRLLLALSSYARPFFASLGLGGLGYIYATTRKHRVNLEEAFKTRRRRQKGGIP